MAENKKTIFRGVGTALITPMRDGEVDYPALRTLIDRQVELGADALVICGTTGESATLSDTERRRCIASAIEYTDGRVPVIAGTGSNNIEKAASLSRYASDAGADALLVVTPYYNKATPEGLRRSFLHIARSASAPLILYNVPSRTGCDIPISVYRELARDERIVAVKEASGNPVAAQKIIAETDGALDVYSGNDELAGCVMALGGAGVISVVSNLLPDAMHRLTALCDGQSHIEAASLQRSLLPLCDALFSAVNPIPVKTALAMMGLCTYEMRLPLCRMSRQEEAQLREVMKRYGLLPEP